MNHGPKQLYQTWKAAHPPLMAFERRGVRTVAEWQIDLRHELLNCLGEMPQRLPVEARQIDESDQGDYLRQKWALHTEPGFWLPFYLLLPKNIDDPRPAVLSIHGHGPGKSRNVGIVGSEAEAQMIARDREDFGLQAVQQGYIAFCPDMRGFGECVDDDHRDEPWSCRYSASRSIMLGRTLLGERIWDISRALDFLTARPDVDPERIACVGHSGGATAAQFASAIEPRIKVSVINAYLCMWDQSIYGVGHCNCNYVPNLARFAECGDIAALIAPRPLLVNNGSQDDIFPIGGARLAYETVRAAYHAYRSLNKTELYVGRDGHRFYPERTWPFLAKWL